ncbi:MAG: hypothetical protein ROW52_14445 [Anaerolineaceae bacterium]|jgi:hypothetical protein
MSELTNRLEEVFELFRNRLATAEALSVSDLFSTDNPPGIGSPLRALNIHIQGAPFALIGLSSPSVSPLSSPLINYLGRRARAHKLLYLLVCNQHEAILLPTPARDGMIKEPLRKYPVIFSISPNATDPLAPIERNELINVADHMASDLRDLHRDGGLDLVLPDVDFFVDRLTRTVQASNRQAVFFD